ncbi:MAG: hypothetical protein GX465_15360 [Acidobacteria bacterium]|jgi:hypothetical protein|nr:hypothetical protein [Acidobacteriota bacterium]
MTVTESIASAPIIDAEETEFEKIQKEYYSVLKEWSEAKKEWETKMNEALLPIRTRLENLERKKVALGPKPDCFGTRTDLDLPGCELCIHGARCFRAMKAKGLI